VAAIHQAISGSVDNGRHQRKPDRGDLIENENCTGLTEGLFETDLTNFDL